MYLMDFAFYSFEQFSYNIGCEVLTAVVIKSTIFWDITPCSLLKHNRHFGETYLLDLQGRRISRVRDQRYSRWQAEPGSEDRGEVTGFFN
jgi:hypothetical protein